MATATHTIVVTVDTSQFKAALDNLRAVTDHIVARVRARRIVVEVLEEHARRGGPTARAALDELDHRDARLAYRIRHERWQRELHMAIAEHVHGRPRFTFRATDIYV